MAAKFGLFVDEDHRKLPTLYWLPKLHKRPYKSRFIANSSACTTTELSILLTSCLTAIKNHVIKYCTTVYERNGKKLFWYIKNSGEILSKHVFNIFGVMYVILMLHAYVTILRGLTGLILWHILMSNENAPPTKMTISF